MKLTIPEKSNKTDYVTISIESIRITRSKIFNFIIIIIKSNIYFLNINKALDTYMAQFPDYDFNTCSFQNIDDKLLIFEKELVIDKEIPSEVFDFNINKLNVYYFFTYDEEKLFLSANQIDLQINKPLNSVVASDIIKKWKFKDLIKINNINSLSLNTNLGIIDLVLKIIKTNTKEDSEIYPYVKDVFI